MSTGRGSPNEVTQRQLREGIDFDEDESLPGEEEDRARKPVEPDEHLPPPGGYK